MQPNRFAFQSALAKSCLRRVFHWSLVFGIGCFSGSVHAAPKNILLLIADDYGVDSSSLYNTTTTGAVLPPTPNIASLASNGVTFTRAYANPVCSPTRACLLTGRFGFRTGIGDVVGGTQGPLAATEFTLPKAFTNAALGYQLAQFGKWHLDNTVNSPLTVGGWTNYAGNLIGQIASYTNWSKTVNGVTTISTNYATTDLVNDATNWIAARGTNAWFLWAAFNAPHTPFHLPPTNLCPHYAGLSGTAGDINANPVKYFDAMVEALDTEIGRLLAALPSRTNTHIIFLGDNGTLRNVLQPPFPNTRGKETLYEGGTHVPLIISGPAVVSPNRTNDTLISMVDVYATILEMAGSSVAAAVPTNVTIDSQSLLPVLKTNNLTQTRYSYSELFGAGVLPSTNAAGRTLHNSPYKVIAFFNGTNEFYDLKSDPYEATNLLATTMNPTQSGNYYSLVLKLGDYQIALAKPVINSFAWSNANFTVTVQRNLTNSYGLWRASSLDGLNWSPLTNSIIVTNGTSSVTLTDTNASAGQNFYRVESH